MADSSKGRGRGLALLQALKSQLSPSSSEESSPQATPGPSGAPSVAPSVVSSTSTMGGRGRVAAMFLTQAQSAGPVSYSPASDVSPRPPQGRGRGIHILESLKAAIGTQPPYTKMDSEVDSLTDKIAETTISISQTSSIAKNKYFEPSCDGNYMGESIQYSRHHVREVKDTPPVVKMGESGTPCEVTANFIYLNFDESNVFEYEVVYAPEQDYKHMRFRLLNEHRHLFKEKTFDGTTLYVPHSLPDEALNLVSTNPFDDSKVKITIIFRRTRRLSEMIHIYNVLFKQIMKDLELVRFGRQYFNEHSAIQIPQHKLEVWPGYVTAVDEYEGGLMLTLDSTHRVLRTQSVLSLIKDTIQTESANWKNAISDKLIGYSVMTTYNKKLFRVDSIDENMNPMSTFERIEKGQTVKITYVEYYKRQYGIDIIDVTQPMLISRDTKRMPGVDHKVDYLICLVPELCQLTGLSDAQRDNFRLMKDVATYTRITPNQRHFAFKKFIQNVMENETAKNRLKGWGLRLAPETVNLTARTLPPETIHFGNNVKVAGKPNADWNGDVCRNSVMQAVDILRWVILYTQRDKSVTNDFVDTIKRCSRPMGINVAAPDCILLPNDRVDTYVMALKKCITTQMQLIVAICPTIRDDRYAAIKRICCAENPIPSQVINARTLSNSQKLRSVTQKILLQINCKLGGTLWHISIPLKSVMVIGIDAYHHATMKKQSVFSFVASYNQSMTSWYSKAVFQESGQEMGDGLKCTLVEALQHYLCINGRLPDRIIIYRDGVGDGQLNTIKKYEIPQLQISLSCVGEDYKPTITYVVVQKRINTRIFLKAGAELANPNPGTVLDHTVTRRDWYDFLIVSQKVNQGTVTPTHYIVIHDDSGMTPDQCQRLTYKMCHLYYNWPGTVRVPAPCQYAHKLAYLVGQNMHVKPSPQLQDKLFFL